MKYKTIFFLFFLAFFVPNGVFASIFENPINYTAPNWTWTYRSGQGYNSFQGWRINKTTGLPDLAKGFSSVPYGTPANLISNNTVCSSATSGYVFSALGCSDNAYIIYTYNSTYGTSTGNYDISYFQILGGNITTYSFVPPDTSTHFTSFTVSTTTGTVNVQGYWNATTTSGSCNGVNCIYQQIVFYQFDDIFGKQSIKTYNATTTGNFNWTFPYIDPPTTTGTTTASFASDTTFHAKIYEYNNNYFNDPFSGIIDPRYQTLLVSTSTTLSAGALYYSIASTTASLFAYPEYECGITSMIGCIKNALIWAFYPTKDTISKYNDFLALIQSKAPVGYFTIVKSNLSNISATSTPQFSVVIPYSLKHYIFDPFDIGISGILWFFFIFNFYKRLKHITI